MANHIHASVMAIQGMGLVSAFSWSSCPCAGLACVCFEEVMSHPSSGGDQATHPGVAQVMSLDL